MATSKDFLNYLYERLGNSEYVRYRPMMGEYLVYYKGKLVGDVCDNRLFLKPVASVSAALPEAELLPPYEGARPHIHVENIDDGEFLLSIFENAFVELPDKKKKGVKK